MEGKSKAGPVLILVLVGALAIGAYLYISTKGKNDAIAGAVGGIEGLAGSAIGVVGSAVTGVIGLGGQVVGGFKKALVDVPLQLTEDIGHGAKVAVGTVYHDAVNAPVNAVKTIGSATAAGARATGSAVATGAKAVGSAAKTVVTAPVAGVKKLFSYL